MPPRVAIPARRRPPAAATPGALVALRGGGDLGSGVTVALVHAGFRVIVVDLPRPTALRLTVAFSAAAVRGSVQVCDIVGVHATSLDAVAAALGRGVVPVWTGGLAQVLAVFRPCALVDARLRGLSDPDLAPDAAPIVIALGPGFEAGRHCHFVIETHRGPRLGEVITVGQAHAHTGVPGEVEGLTSQRILRSPADGVLHRLRDIGDRVAAGDVVATVAGLPVRAEISGMIRGLRLDGLAVECGRKVGDVDPRCDPALLDHPSDKAQRVGAGVVAAVRRGLVAMGCERDPQGH